MKATRFDADRRVSLDEFAVTHAVWDPMPLWDGRRFLLYVLAMDRDSGMELGSFFTRDNTIHAFESSDGRTWQHLGVAIRPRTARERLCAGNPLFRDGRYWFFGSATVDQYDENHLDQRAFLMVSDDGLHFAEVPEFRLEPDPEVCPHRRFHPVDGRMLFAWRDPWPLVDDETGRCLVFICTGGERWGCDPDVIVAEADSLAGPYRLLGSALDFPTRDVGDLRGAFGEIERVNVLRVGARWYLTFSCWRRLVDDAMLSEHATVEEPLTDFTVYAASADDPRSVFRFSIDRPPLVRGSGRTGFYGTTFFGAGGDDMLALGWDWPAFRIRGSGSLQLVGARQPGTAADIPALRWTPWQHLGQGLVRAVRALRRLARKLLRLPRRVMGWRGTAGA